MDVIVQLTRKETIRTVSAFDPGGDGLAAKSKDLILLLLSHGSKPFSGRQFWPGHVTCTALIIHPSQPRVLVIHHHRLGRWLLPGGHVEKQDSSLHAVAAREACEETGVEIDSRFTPYLAGMDVHGIPPKQREPYHLHHDLIWCFRAANERIAATPEAPELLWAGADDWGRLDLTQSIRNSIARVFGSVAR
jgi:8-oxo-dGTP pyrophosphatase MutT (NUDIX family)